MRGKEVKIKYLAYEPVLQLTIECTKYGKSTADSLRFKQP